MKKSLSLLFSLIIPLIFPQLVSAQIIINEISSGSSDEDWVEIYNNSANPVLLTEFVLKDKSDNEKPLTGTLDPEAFISFNWSNRLNNAGDIVYLFKISDSSQIDSISYGTEGGVCAPETNQSIGRYDNGNTIERFGSHTKGLTNVGANILPCPTPTPTLQPTAQPTVAPTKTSTPSPIPTKTATPVPTKSPTSKPTPTPTDEPEVLGESSTSGVSLMTNSPLPTSTSAPLVKGKKLTLPIIFITSGVLLLGFAVLQLINAKKSAQTIKSLGSSSDLGGNNI